jgi:hypothetical protein
MTFSIPCLSFSVALDWLFPYNGARLAYLIQDRIWTGGKVTIRRDKEEVVSPQFSVLSFLAED